MANDSKQYQEEEYLFSEDEQTDPLNPGEPAVGMPGQTTSEKESFFKTWRKNVFIGVGLLIVVYVVYKLISSFFVSNDVKKIPSIPAQSATQQIAPMTQASVTPVASSNAPLPDSVNLYNQNRQQGQQINQLNQTVQSLSNELSSLQGTTQSLQTNMNVINNQLNQMNQMLMVLTNQMKVQETRWQQSQRKAKSKSVASQPIVKKVSYQTMAVIPGRAWLKSSRGATITVSIGTDIPEYGKVTKIQTQSGKITTSSGVVIQYAPDDE